MKTLVFFGSPHKDGDTACLLNAVLKDLPGDVVFVDAYRDNIAPCVDCRKCRENAGCVIRDDMDKVYDALADADNVIIAAPLYFSELPGPLLSVMSRLQCLYSAKAFLGEKIPVHIKRGGIILVGGGSGGSDRALATCVDLMKNVFGVKAVGTITSLHTDTLPAAKDEKALNGAKSMAAFLAERA